MFAELEHLPSEARKDLDSAYRQLQRPGGAKLLWAYLTVAEQKRLGPDYLTAYQTYGGTIQLWLYLRGGTPWRAIADVAQTVGLLSESARRRLLRELGEPDAASASSVNVEWIKTLGELRLNDEVIRRVRVGHATKVVPILDAFQECGWPEHIDDPITAGDGQRLRDALKVLNRGLERIRFHADGTGEGIRWCVL